MAHKKKEYIWREFFDAQNENKIVMRSDNKVQTLYLKLKSENRKRLLGAVTISTRTMRVRRNRSEHLYRIGNAYGFNHYVLSTTKRFDTINLSDEFEDWKIPVKFILENGKILFHKQQGFELQIFVSLEQIQQFKTTNRL